LAILLREKELGNETGLTFGRFWQTSESMVQGVWGQLEAVGLEDSAVVATSKSQVDMIQSQLGDFVGMVVGEKERKVDNAKGTRDH